MEPHFDAPSDDDAVLHCHIHPDRETGRRCTRCGRPACPGCLQQSAVGAHCTTCRRAAAPAVSEQLRMQLASAGPIVSYALIAVNVVVALYVFASAGGITGRVTRVHVDYALIGPGVDDLGEWWRIFTSGFLHYGLLHLAFNCFAIFVLGQAFERSFGRLPFTVLYFASMAGGSFGALLLNPLAFTAGASGAVFGVMGGGLVALRNRGVDPSQTGLVPILVLNLLITFTIPGISIGGHLGGLAAGALTGWVMAPPGRRLTTVPAVAAGVVVGAAAVAGALWAATRGEGLF